MRSRRLLALGALLLTTTPGVTAAQDTPVATAIPAVTPCRLCAEWNVPRAPFRVFGNTWYVGTNGLSALLVTGPQGHVLLDGALPESAPQLLANIRTLGFDPKDIKAIVNSHAHYDHAGGISALQRASGATVWAHAWSAEALRTGRDVKGDPQFGTLFPYPPVAKVRVLREADTVRVGALALAATFTGGHTPGGTTWSWRSCEGERCEEMVYADSQSALSSPGFLFTANPDYPDAVADAARGQARLEALPCTVLVTPHPGGSRLFERLAAREAGDAEAMRDPSACRTYVERARAGWAERVARERGTGK